MRTLRISLVAVVLLAFSLVSCGNDTPAVCTSADDLKASIDDLKNVDILAANGIQDAQDKLAAVKDDFAQLKADANTEFQPQIDAVSSALDTLQAGIETATGDPAAANVAAVATAASNLLAAAQTLVNDVKETC